jgi:dTDP-4-amino-4,6-dideoxygalactose transaminase
MNDFLSEPEALRRAELDAFTHVLDSGRYILGPHVSNFEHEWSRFCGTAHCVGVANGMDAIEIGLRALDLAVGDEVITNSMTAFATVLGVMRAGAVPVLADIDPATGLADLASIERCCGPKTRALLFVHLYGRIGDMSKAEALCRGHGIHLLEDCAQAHAAKWHDRVAGSFGTFGAYSFYPTKNLGAIGDAGAIVTADAQIDQRCRSLRNYGQTGRMVHDEPGLNSRLDELQAGLLSARLRWLEEFTVARRRVAQRYDDGIASAHVRKLAPPASAENHVHHLYVITCDERERLAKHLEERGVETAIHYPLPIHHQRASGKLRQDPRGLANAERHATTCLSLPCHPQLSDGDVARVVEAVNSFK